MVVQFTWFVKYYSSFIKYLTILVNIRSPLTLPEISQKEAGDTGSLG